MAKRAPVTGWRGSRSGMALVAFVLALYGSLHAEKHIAGSPLREARGSAGLPAEPTKWYERLIAKGENAVFGDRIRPEDSGAHRAVEDRELLAASSSRSCCRSCWGWVRR